MSQPDAFTLTGNSTADGNATIAESTAFYPGNGEDPSNEGVVSFGTMFEPTKEAAIPDPNPGKVDHVSAPTKITSKHDKGDKFMARIGDGRYVTVSLYRGSVLVHLRDYIKDEKSGKMYATKKGIATQSEGMGKCQETCRRYR